MKNALFVENKIPYKIIILLSIKLNCNSWYNDKIENKIPPRYKEYINDSSLKKSSIITLK